MNLFACKGIYRKNAGSATGRRKYCSLPENIVRLLFGSEPLIRLSGRMEFLKLMWIPRYGCACIVSMIALLIKSYPAWFGCIPSSE
jgi:hypothetical protein